MWKTQNSRNMLKTIQLAAFISLRVASFAAEFLPVNDAPRFLRTNEGGPHFTLWLSGPDLSVLTDTLHYTRPVVSCWLVFTPRLVTCNMAHQIEEDWMQHILSSRSTGAFFFFFFWQSCGNNRSLPHRDRITDYTIWNATEFLLWGLWLNRFLEASVWWELQTLCRDEKTGNCLPHETNRQ